MRATTCTQQTIHLHTSVPWPRLSRPRCPSFHGAALLREIDAEKNQLETFIYEYRGHGDGPHSKLFDADKTLGLLSEAEDWLFGEGGDGVTTTGPVAAKLAELRAAAAAINPELDAAIEADRAAKEAELERERARAAAEAPAVTDDHDTRKLKKADRMKKLQMNKAEGTELFKGKNYVHAVDRYRKALVYVGHGGSPPQRHPRAAGHVALC